MRNYIICSKNNFFKKRIKKKNFIFINKKKNLNIKFIKKINPKYIFFPHWNYKIQKNIFNKYQCIGFHSTPLPYGRGGSPVQNMILRGYKKSKVCAIQIEEKFDSGDIYMSKSFSLNGTADQIYIRIYKIIHKMINRIIKKLPAPKKQKGKIFIFKRRKPKESNIENIKNFQKLYDYIRMLDFSEKNFPKAFVNIKKFKLILSSAKLKGNTIKCFCEIKEN